MRQRLSVTKCLGLFLLCVCASVWVSATAPGEDGGKAAGVSKDRDDEWGTVREGPGLLGKGKHRVGRLIRDVGFTDIEGKSGRLSDFRKSKALVVAVTNATCPVSRKYAPRLSRLIKRYEQQGVAFLLLNVSIQDSREEIRRFIESHELSARYVHDEDGALGRALGVRSTGDTFVLDAARTLIYRGPIDDQYGLGYVLPEPKRELLSEALETALAGDQLTHAAYSAPGCAIELDAKNAVEKTEVTYHNRISRIVQANCEVCHRKGGPGPFELTTLKDVVGNKGMIKKVLRRGVMPPWFADPEVGHWANDRRLSEQDLADFLNWFDAGAPEGNAADAPLARQWSKAWTIGKPDMVVKIPNPIRVKAEGAMPYRNVAVRLRELKEDVWVTAAEIRPSQPQVVHHVLIFVRYPSDHPRAAEQPDFRGGIRGAFLGMVPGQQAMTLGDGFGKFLPAGSILQFQLHYTPNGTEAWDQTELAIRYTKTKPAREVWSGTVFNAKFEIPPNDGNFKVTARRRFDEAVRLMGFSPHMHVRGKAFKYELITPDGKRRTLLNVPSYDFNWQLVYRPVEAIDVPAGSQIYATAWFDNSAGNPANPDPTKTVRFGEQTWDEMMIGYFDYYPIR